MTELLAVENEGETTSRDKTRGPGVFRSTLDTQSKQRPPLFPRTVNGEVRPPKNILSKEMVEKIKAAERLRGKVEATLVDAKNLLANVSELVDSTRITSIIKSLEVLSSEIGSETFSSDELESKILIEESKLSTILRDVVASAKKFEDVSKKQEDEIARLKLVFIAQSNFKELSNVVRSFQELGKTSHETYKNIMSQLTALEWLDDVTEVELFAKKNDPSEIVKLYNDIETLTQNIAGLIGDTSVLHTAPVLPTETTLRPPAFLSRTIVTNTESPTEPEHQNNKPEAGEELTHVDTTSVIERAPPSLAKTITYTTEKTLVDRKNNETLAHPQDDIVEKTSDNNIFKKHTYGENLLEQAVIPEQIPDETPREYLDRLTTLQHKLEKRWVDVYGDLAHGTAFGQPHEEAKALQEHIKILDSKIQEITKIALESYTHPTTLQKRVEALTGAEERVLPAAHEPVSTSTDTMILDHIGASADEQNDVETMQTEMRTTERAQKMQKGVENLMKSFSKFPSSKYPWGTLAGGIPSTKNTPETNTKRESEQPKGRTLADVIKNQPSWRSTITEHVPQEFIFDFSGPKSLSFDDFIKKYTPAFAIGPNNPSVKDKVANLLCDDVYDIEGANDGLTEKQQREVATILKNLQTVIEAVGSISTTVGTNTSIRYFSGMNVRQFYEVVRKIAAEADEEERKTKLRTI